MAARNMFKGVQIQFLEAMIDHSAYNKQFDRDGFRQFMIPAKESSVQLVERELAGYISTFNLKWEREFTGRSEGIVTMYLSSKKQLGGQVREQLARMLEDQTLASVIYGAVKTDASFVVSKVLEAGK